MLNDRAGPVTKEFHRDASRTPAGTTDGSHEVGSSMAEQGLLPVTKEFRRDASGTPAGRFRFHSSKLADTLHVRCFGECTQQYERVLDMVVMFGSMQHLEKFDDLYFKIRTQENWPICSVCLVYDT